MLRSHSQLFDQLVDRTEQGNHAHAYMFEGAQGIGKKQFVTALVKRIASKEASEQVLKNIDQNIHPDVLFVEKEEEAAEIVLDQIKTAQQRLMNHPVNAPYNCVVIWNAHYLNREASNAFLKMLEEPPAHGMVFLTTSSRSKLLPTIVSRCQRVQLQRGSFKDIVKELIEAGASQEQAEQLAHAAQGRLEVAKQWLNESIWKEHKLKIKEGSSVLTAELPDSLKQIESIAKLPKDEFLELRNHWLELIRDVLLLQQSAGLKLTNEWMSADLALLKDRFSSSRLITLAEKLIDEMGSEKIAFNKRLQLEDLLVSFHHEGAGVSST
ncbi:MAG: hypothetical protein HN991_04355 [Candidatus Jacksonbacteria bacterium]|nr:hypothetical protein [Candidatus Jacksonbacteria bacterium]